MKFLNLIILTFLSFLTIGQEDWILYPKNNNSSINNKRYTSIINDTLPNFNRKIKKTDSLVNYITKDGFLLVNKDIRIDSLNKLLKKYGTYNLYSVQLSFSQETDVIKKLRKRFIELYPNEELYDEYNAPNIYLYAGKFYSRNDATLLKKQLEHSFENTMVVMKSFPLLESQFD